MLQLPPDAEHATSERREDAIPATLATLLLQYLSTLALPSAPRLDTLPSAASQDDLHRQADAHVPSTKALRPLVEQLLQDHNVLDAIQRVLDTTRMSNAGEPSGAAGGTEARTVPHTEAGGKPLDIYAQVLTPVLAKLLTAHLDAVVGQAAPPEQTAPSRMLPLPLETYLYVLSAAHYQAVREVLAYGTFAEVEGTPWPTAQLTKGHARGHAQLRPVVTDQQPFLPPEEVERWGPRLWHASGRRSPTSTPIPSIP